MPEITWKTAKLGDLCSIKTGKLPAKAAVEDGEYPFFTANTSKDCKTDTYSYDTEAVLMSKDGEYAGFVRYYNGKFDVSNHSFVITNFKGIEAKYIKYYLQNTYEQIRALASGGAIPGISMAVLSSLEIRYPESLEHQKLVARILSDLDSLASLHKSKADILSKMKSQLMSNKTGIIEQERQKSEIPAGWVKVKLGDIATFVNGVAFKPDDWSDEGVPIIRIQNLTSNAEYHYYNGYIQDKNSITDGDIILSWSATIDSFIYHGDNGVLNQHLFKVTPKNVDKKFLFYILKANNDGLKLLSHGVSMKHIKKGDVENYTVMIPSTLQEQQRIAKILESYDGLIESQSQLIQIVERERAVTERIAHSLVNEIALNG